MSRFASVVVLLLPLLVSNASPSHSLSGPHIADVDILLPPRMTHPVEYRLQGSDGCFECYAKPWKDFDIGISYCLFFPYSPEHLARSTPNAKEMKQDISVSISISLRGANQISGSATTLFVIGFSILEMDKNSMQLRC
ncbi:nuclear pore complex protein GP210-like [Actinidia eriantha]|uniref:nuclear pore complex protein GP210-like n=1 Tax=Actinidia eriantha TaxID=165200 RepID=UPI0025840F90|nr:nuclear pore complex protein GP210-like [Actinidia eriantha]XP_057481197.1 nuclear pore complex protein GP210-like [Actinidia eriantha]XP_057481198.1 nuclear pore complex protein GP210-like [Actinidia eriantha]